MSDLFDRNAASVNVGGRLADLRQERNLSVRALARASGLSANALSMIERGRTSPSVSTLYRLAEAMQVPVTAFFRAEPSRQKVVFCKANERTHLPFSRGLWEGLGGENFIGRVEPFILTLEAGGSSGPHGMLHSGHEFVLCLRGQLEYLVEGQRYLLEPGDSLLFAAQMRHRWRNTGSMVTNALIVLSNFDENESPGEYHQAAGKESESESEDEQAEAGK
jgi:quercetin dioxygenase-like cupin family protein/DNA-binding XRE family transcriptional regulator